MTKNAIDNILESRRQTEKPVEETGDKFFSILTVEGTPEHFLELQFKNGLRTCFSYSDLIWFNFDPEAGCIDMEFGGFMVTIKGRGLGIKLFDGLRRKRVSTVKEADSDMQDHKDNETFIEEITITPPKGADEPETSAS